MAHPAGERLTASPLSSTRHAVGGRVHDGPVTEEDVIQLFTDLPSVVAVTAADGDGSPEVAWGDTFVHYEPDGRGDRMFPFATIVIKDYRGFDTASELDRAGVYRVNLAVGRAAFEEILGYPPAAFAEHAGDVDFAELDQLMPHPVYGKQAWISVVVPGDRTAGRMHYLVTTAYQREQRRRRAGRTGRDEQ